MNKVGVTEARHQWNDDLVFGLGYAIAQARARRLASLRAQTSGVSGLELALKDEYAALGYVAQYPLLGIGGITTRRSADYARPDDKVAVFVDGCYWHVCPEHFVLPRDQGYDWAAKFERTQARDRDTNERLAAAGWEVVRIWEHELR